MSVAEQFTGLDMENLIGGPLAATANDNVYMAQVTAEFINNVGTMEKDVPMPSIVPIPNLQVNEVNIQFDMEVEQSEESDSNTD